MSLIETLNDRLGEVLDIQAAVALLHWDQEVYMPSKGAGARGRQLATLSALAHRLFTSEEIGALLSAAEKEASLSGDETRLVSEARYDYAHAVKLPESFVERFAEEQSKAYEAWTKARAASDFSIFAPHLEKLVELLRRKADYLGYEGTPYNALLEEYERGLTTEQLRVLFKTLAEEQSALLGQIMRAPQPNTSWEEQEWPESTQWELTLRVLRDMGFDFEAGRQDRSVHPFTTNFDRCDVRITTRVNRKELFSALTGSIHEGGHALYEQGFLERDQRTWLAQAPSLGIHESQSRMWENMVGRSLAFWRYYTPVFRAAYPGQLDAVTPEMIYQAINMVHPSFIRVEADECTYNLHIILRFEIELGLIEGTVRVSEVPELWNAKVKQYLGLDVPNDALGCLQDIHWSHGSMGYFPTYALGNLYAAQLFEKIEEDIPGLWSEIEAGSFTALRDWLRAHVHQFGRRKTAPEIVQAATGKAPSAEPFLRYLRKKYSALYGLA